MTHPADLPTDELLKQCELQFVRRSGPGGQHRNKVETGVHIRHLPTEIEAEASERRSQADNRKVALRRLRVKLAVHVRTDRADDDSPGALWKSRTANRRIAVNEQHDDFPSLLAEALDALQGREFDLKSTAEFLGISSTQLVKLLKQEPGAFSWVNAQRETLQMHRLK